MLSQKTIQEVFKIAEVHEVISEFINLKRRGVNYIGNCPFHDEKTPSFTVSTTKNIYKCFGCGKGGDPVRFIMDHENISFPEAIKYLANKYNISIEETEYTNEELEKKKTTDSLYIVNEFAKNHFVHNLWHVEEGKTIGLSYFKERGFSNVTIEKFQLGYSGNDSKALINDAKNSHYNLDLLKSLGLASQNDNDFYRQRVMFPIHNIIGKVIGFGGRTLSADKKIPKYINSIESEIYSKRTSLYGLYFAKESIRKQDECILVEGYTDVISLHQSGIENVVASSGTSLTVEQIRLIKRYTPNIKILYDGDSAGIKAALRGLDLVLEQDMNVKLVLLPNGEDPDSYCQKVGTYNFETYIKNEAEDFLFFKTKLLIDDTANDPIAKAAGIKDIVTSIAKIPETFKRTIYIKQCATLLDIKESILVEEVNKIIKSNKKNAFSSSYSEENSTDSIDVITKPKLGSGQQYTWNDEYQEAAVCKILIQFGSEIFDTNSKQTVAQFITEHVAEHLSIFDNDLYVNILTIAINALKNEEEITDSLFVTNEDEAIRNFAISALSSPYVYASWDTKEMYLQTQEMPEKNYIRDTLNAMQRLQLQKSIKIIAEVEKLIMNASEEEKLADDYLLNIKTREVLVKQRNELAKSLGTIPLLKKN